MAKVHNWEDYLEDNYKDKPQKVKKFKDSEDKPKNKKRRKSWKD